MANIFIQNVYLNGKITNIRISGNRFEAIGSNISINPTDTIIDGKDKAILPPFYNTHTHAAMTLLRGYAEDMPLFKWLNEYIWPFEDTLTTDDIYLGTRLAILEMIKSGTVFFNDMYWHLDGTLQAVKESGIRAALGIIVLDFNADSNIPMAIDYAEEYRHSDLIDITIAPHAIYTCSAKNYQRCADIARKCNIQLHTHLSETQKEFDDCRKQHNGLSPVQFLDNLGALDCNTIAAHCVVLDDKDFTVLSNKKVCISHCPISNHKLASGIFPMLRCLDTGCKVTLGTDGCSSNNNLDMLEEMKFASLATKVYSGAESLPVKTLMQIATRNGAKAFDIEAGEIAVGKLADAILIDLNNERMVPLYDLLSNWAFSAQSNCIDTVICNGKILMQDHIVAGEEELIKEVRSRFNRSRL